MELAKEASTDTLMSCRICINLYNETENRPLVFTCGHTFCKECAKNCIRHGRAECPFDKKHTQVSNVDQLPTNFDVLSIILDREARGQKVQARKKTLSLIDAQFCPKHFQEKLVFYCKKDNTLLCQLCALSDHMGAGHELTQSRVILMKKECEVIAQKVSKVKEGLQSQVKNSTIEASDANEKIEIKTLALIAKLECQLKDLKEKNKQILANYLKEHEDQYRTVQQIQNDLNDVLQSMSQSGYEANHEQTDMDILKLDLIVSTVKKLELEQHKSQQKLKFQDRIEVDDTDLGHVVVKLTNPRAQREDSDREGRRGGFRGGYRGGYRGDRPGRESRFQAQGNPDDFFSSSSSDGE